MTKYTYKGFIVKYDIKPRKQNDHIYRACGSVLSCIDQSAPTLMQKFQTESPTKKDAQHEIKRLVNDYIDFEWEEFIAMQSDR